MGIVFVLWFFTGQITSFALGFDLPLLGFVGVEPFSFLSEFYVLIVGLGSLLVYYMLTRREYKK